MKGGKLLAAIVGCGWVASYVLTANQIYGDVNESPVLIAARALPAALFVGLIAWAISEKHQPVTLTAKPICWTTIVIGILGYGKAYSQLSDQGVPYHNATLYAFVGVQGAIIIVGVAGLLLGKRHRSE